MTRQWVRRIVLALAVITVASCAPANRFVWGDYERSLYSYYSNPVNREIYQQNLVKAIEEGERWNKVAPGLNAELGYLYLEEGQPVQAATYFRREMDLFPESKKFLIRYVSANGEGAGQ